MKKCLDIIFYLLFIKYSFKNYALFRTIRNGKRYWYLVKINTLTNTF